MSTLPFDKSGSPAVLCLLSGSGSFCFLNLIPKGGINMSVPTLPKGKTAILVMDCQNDIVHEQGKVGGSLTAGAMPKMIKEKNILGNIQKLMSAGRTAK